MNQPAFDPRAKIIVYLLGSGLVLLATRPPALLLIAGVQAVLLTRLGLLTRWLVLLRALLPTLAIFALAAWWSDGPVAASVAALRLVTLVSAGVLFFGTTPPEELGEALQASGLSPQVAFLLEGTLRFVPTMGALLAEVRDAQASRGLRVDGLHLLRTGPALLAPVLVGALRLADDLAEGLEARGFGSPGRTLLRDYRWRGRDWLLVGGMSAVTVVIGGWILHQ